MSLDQGESWTVGPAKWAAVLVLGAASIGGLVWSARGRAPNPLLAPARSPGQPAAELRSEPSTPVEQGRRPAPPAADATLKTINLNTAGAAELELLPGIGPGLAARIIEDRAAHGAFKSVNDLDRIKGIGPKTIQKLRPLVRVE